MNVKNEEKNHKYPAKNIKTNYKAEGGNQVDLKFPPNNIEC